MPKRYQLLRVQQRISHIWWSGLGHSSVLGLPRPCRTGHRSAWAVRLQVNQLRQRWRAVMRGVPDLLVVPDHFDLREQSPLRSEQLGPFSARPPTKTIADVLADSQRLLQQHIPTKAKPADYCCDGAAELYTGGPLEQFILSTRRPLANIRSFSATPRRAEVSAVRAHSLVLPVKQGVTQDAVILASARFLQSKQSSAFSFLHVQRSATGHSAACSFFGTASCSQGILLRMGQSCSLTLAMLAQQCSTSPLPAT